MAESFGDSWGVLYNSGKKVKWNPLKMEDLKDDVSFSKGSFVGFQLVVLGEIGS